MNQWIHYPEDTRHSITFAPDNRIGVARLDLPEDLPA